MDVLVLVVVLLLVFALVALMLAKVGRARQTARTAELYGHARTFQPTFGKSAAAPGRGATVPGPSADASTVPGSSETEATETMERMARGLAELLKIKDVGNATHETGAGANRQHPHQ